MTRTYLIVENEQMKAEQIIYNLKLQRDHVLIVRNVEMAKQLLYLLPGPMCLILDGELDPGCGYGIEVLDYAIAKHPEKISGVIANSFSSDMDKEMVERAKKALIPANLASKMGV